MQELINLQQEIHQWAKDWGFWENGQNRNKGEMVMLMITELSEAVEAHRKGNTMSKLSSYAREQVLYDALWPHVFEVSVKDTVEDEIADAVIRILDYTAGWDIPLLEREYRKQSTGNFGHDVLRIVQYCLYAYHLDTDDTVQFPGKDWGYVLTAIIKFCEWYNINLLQHVQWKMQYNRTRPHKHGKSY